MVLARSFSNSDPEDPPLLQRAIRAYRKLTLTGRGRTQPSRPATRRVITLTDVQIVRLVERYREGATVYRLAEEFQISRSTVGEHLHRQGVVLRRSPTTPEEVTRAITLYQQGLSMVQVGQQLGRSASLICHTLKQAGIQARDSHGRPRA